MRISRYLIAAALAVFFIMFLAGPLYTVLAEGSRPEYFAEIFRNPVYLEGLLNSFKIAVVTTALVFVIAVPLALLSDRFEFRGKAIVNVLLLVPMILPPFVGALGFQQIFGQYGAFNSVLMGLGFFEPGQAPDWTNSEGSFWLVCVIEALHLYPILFLNTLTSLANVDPSLSEAARGMGAGAWRRFWSIKMPLIRPGLFAGGSIVLIWSFTELGTPLMFGYNRVTAVQIFNGVTELETNPLPYSLVIVMLVLAGGTYAIGRLLFGSRGDAAVTKGIAGSSARPVYGLKSLLVVLPFLLVTFLAILPHFGMFFLSISRDWFGTPLPTAYTISHYSNALGHKYVVPSIVNSLIYSSLAMVLCTATGLLTAVLVVRWRIKGWRIFDIASMLPLAIPGLVMAFGYLSMANRFGSLFPGGLDPIENPTILLVIAYAMRRLPYVTRAAAAGLEQTPEDMELASRNLGAGSIRTLRKIIVPLLAANLVVGALFAFSFSMLEVSDSLILAQKSAFYPITRAIYELSQVLGSGPYIACAFGVWAMLFLASTLYAASRILGKKMGALFRF